jgi:hypothetical protein
MRRSHAIANWIFERLRLDVALTGDLLEECVRGRSAIWYWRQVLIAVWIGIWGAIRDHKLLAMRAVATGCATNYVFLLLWWRFLDPFGLPNPGSMVSIVHWIPGLSIILLSQSATGWVVARTHRAQPVPMVLVFVIWLLLWDVYDTSSMVRMLLVDSIDRPRILRYLALYLAPMFVTNAGLLVGGIFGAPPQERAFCGGRSGWPSPEHPVTRRT